MNEKLSPFQIIVFGVLIVMIVISVILFALKRQEDKQAVLPITMWGTVSADLISDFQRILNEQQNDSVNIIYTEFSEENFERQLVEALASRQGPDAVIFPDEMILRHENKIFPINYEFYTQKTFTDTFIEAGEILLREQGILGFPLLVDPLVLYWNRTILNNEGVSQPPRFWDDFLTLVPRLVRKDSTGNISRAAVAMGELNNIKNGKELLITLIQQAGNDVVARNAEQRRYVSVLGERMGFTLRPADTAVNFFAQFANPARNVYSWNKALPQSDESFLSGDLAFYFGFASERQNIITRNPNLNFGIAILPQSRSSNRDSTFGKMHFVAILNQSQNVGNAFINLTKITDKASIEVLTELTGLPSVRRDYSRDGAPLAFMDVFNRSALISRPFIDPNRIETQNVFQLMVGSVVSGSADASGAVDRANLRLIDLLQ